MKRLFLLCLTLILLSTCVAQDCIIRHSGYSKLSFRNLGLVADEYNNITSFHKFYQICLIESSGPTAKCYNLKLDSNNVITLEEIDENHIIKCTKITKPAKSETTDIVSKFILVDTLRGFYHCYCNNATSKYSYTLIATTPSNKIIEFSSMNLNIDQVVYSEPKYKFILQFFDLLKSYFPNSM